VTIDDAITLVQFCYPQIYYACHTRHERKRSSALRLSRRDAELLVHLSPSSPTTLTELAQHMDLAASTASEAVAKLEALGYVQKAQDSRGDRRRVGIALTKKGVDAVRATSVLEPARLRGVLGRLSIRDRATVTNGLRILARACRPASALKKGA
jgi:DNA-binding MarR family transcriptional regulator